jgi:hypothetical protein
VRFNKVLLKLSGETQIIMTVPQEQPLLTSEPRLDPAPPCGVRDVLSDEVAVRHAVPDGPLLVRVLFG